MHRIPVAVAVLALAGCGGSGGGRLSASEYRSEADAICAEANTKLTDLGSPSTPAELRELMKKARPTLERAIDDLEALKPPESLASKADEWNGKNDQLLEKYDELSKETDLAQLQKKAQELGQLNEETNAFARAQLGLHECAAG
jgi:hypothetical protein